MPLTKIEPYRKRLRTKRKVLMGTPCTEVIHEVLREGHDLVIKVPEDPSWLALQFGSNDIHLLRKCPCPVWFITCQAPKAYRRILAAVDLPGGYAAEEWETRETLNRQILEMAGSMALAEFAELHVVHVWEAIGEGVMRSASFRMPEEEVAAYLDGVRRHHEASLDALLHELESAMGSGTLAFLKPRTHLVRGSPSKEIPALAERLKADLVVMGTVGRSGIPGLIMGNTAETVLYQLDCSVVAIKPPGFVSPVAVSS